MLKYKKRGFTHRSEEHTSELQSRPHLVCRLLLEKKDSKDLYEISPALPSPADYDLLLRRAERPLDESDCCPGFRTLFFLKGTEAPETIPSSPPLLLPG